MKPAPFHLLLQTASRDNILTLTTACGTACCFCSHRQNPPEVEAFSVDGLTEAETDTLIDFLDGRKKVVIGESATRICEGEPFLFDRIFEVLAGIRKRHKAAAVQITTSGVPLDGEKLEKLKRLGPVELNVSLNSSSEAGRRRLYNGKAHMEAVAATGMRSGCGISFHGSIVAMPHVVGWQDIEDTVLFLAAKGARTVRLFMPGHTRYGGQPAPPADIRGALRDFAASVGAKARAPVLVEPPAVEDLAAVVEGVIEGTPGYLAGIKPGDTVLTVDGARVFSRVDAYYRLFNGRNPIVALRRAGALREAAIKKEKDAASGLAFSYDIHPDTIAEIKRVIRRNNGRRCLILTSTLAYPILRKCIELSENVGIDCARNLYFGGNIVCAGLLTVRDVMTHLEGLGTMPQVVLLPSVMFDLSGRDLLGRHYSDIEERFGVVPEVV